MTVMLRSQPLISPLLAGSKWPSAIGMYRELGKGSCMPKYDSPRRRITCRPCAAKEHSIAQHLRLPFGLVQVGNKGNIESMFIDLLKIMRHTEQCPREEKAAIIAEGVMSTFCRKWEGEEPRFVHYFSAPMAPQDR